MHFRVRKKVVQLVRTTYVPDEKEPQAKVVASLLLAAPQITEELKNMLTPAELEETQEWIAQHHHLMALKDELAALQLADNIDMARRWLKKESQSSLALRTAAEIRDSLQPLKKALKSLLEE